MALLFVFCATWSINWVVLVGTSRFLSIEFDGCKEETPETLRNRPFALSVGIFSRRAASPFLILFMLLVRFDRRFLINSRCAYLATYRAACVAFRDRLQKRPNGLTRSIEHLLETREQR